MLLVVAVVSQNLAPAVAQRLVAWASTDAHNLQHHPIAALITSAFWLPSSQAWVWAIAVAAALTTLERRVGTIWTLAAFAGGHVGATLITELPVVWAVDAKLLPDADSHWLDVGVSYGLFTVVGALLMMLSLPLRAAAMLAVASCILWMYLQSDPSELDNVITVTGHLTSVLIGVLVSGAWLRRLHLVTHSPWLVNSAESPR